MLVFVRAGQDGTFSRHCQMSHRVEMEHTVKHPTGQSSRRDFFLNLLLITSHYAQFKGASSVCVYVCVFVFAYTSKHILLKFIYLLIKNKLKQSMSLTEA